MYGSRSISYKDQYEERNSNGVLEEYGEKSISNTSRKSFSQGEFGRAIAISYCNEVRQGEFPRHTGFHFQVDVMGPPASIPCVWYQPNSRIPSEMKIYS